MAELSWIATSPLSRALVSGRHGAESGAAGVTLTELRGFELVQIMARRGQWQSFAAVAEQFFGVSPPVKRQAVRASTATLIWSGPDQFLALSPRRGDGSALASARSTLAGKASLSEQSDGRVLLMQSGPKARDVLAKFCSLDLHPAAFPQGSAAATSIEHTSVNLWRDADTAEQVPVFFLLVSSTFAESLLHTILDSAAEYGVDVAVATAYELPDL